jgi:hypothetical protein
MKATVLLLLLWSSLALVRCGNTNHDAEPVNSSICEAVRAPERFDRRRIRIQASLVSFGIDVSIIKDGRCPQVGLLLMPGFEKDDSVRKLQQVLSREGRLPSTDDRNVSAEFIGVFRLSPTLPKRFTLQLESVRNVVITSTTGSGPR